MIFFRDLRFEEETSRGVGSNDEKRGGGGGRGFAVDRCVNNFARDAASAYHDVAREGSRKLLALKLHLSVSIISAPVTNRLKNALKMTELPNRVFEPRGDVQ